MDDDERAMRARSFGAIAENYDRFRPGPPPDAVAWLLREPRDVPVDIAVDIGAGTGALTRLLSAHARRVVAVEPDARMAGVLRERVADADVREGSAEHIPLDDGSADAVLGSSMWHWVDEARAAHEVARVLRPGGVFGLLWSGPDRTEGWVAELLAAANPRRNPAETTDAARRRRHEVHLPAGAPLLPPETTTLHWTRTVTLDELAGLAGTFSVVIRLPETERAGLGDRLLEFVRSHPALAGRDEVDLPMRCHCWRAVRT